MSEMVSRKTSRFDAYLEKVRQEHQRNVREVSAALAQSPAIIFSDGDRVELVIVSGETQPGRPPLRATTFMVDGPWGHENYKNMTEVAAELAKRRFDSVRAADEDEVIEWTSTPEFVHGSKVVAYIQAANALRYWASQLRGRDPKAAARAEELVRETDRMDPSDVDRARLLVEAELKAIAPHENPRPNPPWVTKILADSYETVTRSVPPAWLPRLSDVRAKRGVVSARLREYGCGMYGCVLPTLDDRIVLKITTDDTEAQFAKEIYPTLSPSARVTVAYHQVIKLPSAKHHGRSVYLLWRDSADHVGELESELGRRAIDFVEIQHAAAQDVLRLVVRQAPMWQIENALAAWSDAVDYMADQDEVPELGPLARGMADAFATHGIFFGDVHAGNVGVVDGKWLITDPGNVVKFKR